ncbi:MAG TPA: TIGR00266 family protein [Candidatus Hydrogenedentes bacterium]|nr:TIGR00266 family protein [Candidatus Hydrogenedentota bacterium]HOL77471.1 TIGR00266 family protein [Candidatus Hydrogenedentota bacterium]HPO86282.1 TIGR00266 family protein [Candidatus Hydrogenedentota bacterium]
MQYEILYQPSYSIARILLDQGESFMAESGAMLSMSPTIRLEARVAGGGMLGAVKSALGGESIFRTIFTAETGPGELLLAPSYTGDIAAVVLNNQKLYVQSGCYLAGDAQLNMSVEASAKAMFSGEGLFLLTLSGSGLLLLSSFGAIHSKTLADGEEYIVDTSHMVAFESTVQFHIEKAAGKTEGVAGLLKGMVTSALSGEGLVCRYRGPGQVYVQTRSLKSFAQMLKPFLPKPSH